MKRLILPLLASLALAGGCENRRSPNGVAPKPGAEQAPAATAADAPIIESKAFRCGDLPLTVHFSRFQVTVELPDDRFRLAEVSSAGGARYASGADPAEVELWHQGEEAILTVRGTRYPVCVSERSRAPDRLRASGLDGGWSLEWDAASGALRLTRGDATRDGRAERQSADGGFELRGEAGGEGFSLTVERNSPCVPEGGGLPRPHRARIRHGALDEAGCAGSPEEFLTGRTWHVTEVDLGFTPASRMRPEFSFTPGGAVVGQAYCNRFTARWRIEGERLAIEELAATKIACREAELNEAEQQLLDALRAIRRVTLQERGKVSFQSEDGARSVSAIGR